VETVTALLRPRSWL